MPAVRATRTTRRILIVDDEPAISRPVVRYFRDLGHTVDAAAELEEAGALLTFRRYDAAILDLRLSHVGGGEGLSLLQEIRERDPRMSVVILSGYVSREARNEALQLGVEGILSKPQPLSELARLALGEEEPSDA